MLNLFFLDCSAIYPVMSNIRHTSELRDFGQNFILWYCGSFCVFVLSELTWVHNSIFYADKRRDYNHSVLISKVSSRVLLFAQCNSVGKRLFDSVQ